jgi:multicomponent Na+:H+ antiporter subunit E
MHAATKGASLGLILLLVGAALGIGDPMIGALLGLVAAFQFLTAPLATHLIARSALGPDYHYMTPPAPEDLPAEREPQPAPPPRRAWRRHLFVGSSLALLWVVVWRDFSIANLVAGALVAAGALLLFRTLDPHPAAGRFRLWHAVRFVGYFTKELVVATLVVAAEVLTPNNERINQALVQVPARVTTDTVLTLLANSISFTPGTIVIDVSRDPTTLHIHMLHFRGVDEVRTSVAELERHIVLAFGTDEDRRRILSDPPRPKR